MKGFRIRAVTFFSLYKKESEDAVTDSSPQIPILELSSTPKAAFSEPLVGHLT